MTAARGDDRRHPLIQAALDGVTRHLRERGWQPVMRHSCGCNPDGLCAYHAERRAVEHYHPEEIR